MRRHYRRTRHGGCTSLHHASAHVGGSRADAAAETAQIKIGRCQIGSEVAAIRGGVEQSVIQNVERLYIRK